MKNYIKILIPSLPLVIAPFAMTSCGNNDKDQYLVDISGQHKEELNTDSLIITLKFDDGRYAGDKTAINFECKDTEFNHVLAGSKDKKRIGITYSKSPCCPSEYEITDSEMAVSLKNKDSAYTTTYKFYMHVHIKDYEIETYTFTKIE